MKIRLPLLLIVCAFASSALAQSLFVPARYSNEVAVIDTSTNQVVTQIPVGHFPIRIAMTLDRRKAFISDAHSTSISVLDTVAHANIATIPVSRVPGESTITPDGRRLFVVHEAGLNHFNLQCPVDVIDTATNLVITTVLIPGHWAKDILFTLDGRFAYIANFFSGEVDVIDTTTYRVRRIPTAAGALRLCISPAGDRVYVTNNHLAPGSVSVIDTATQQVIATVPVGQGPMGIAIRSDGREVYTANSRGNTVSVIDTTTLSVIATIPTGGVWPSELVTTADGTKCFVVNRNSDNVSVIDTATGSVSTIIQVGHRPFISRISPDQTKLYVSDTRSTTVTVINISSLTVAATIANVGMQPFDMTFGP